jgi:hypothetical protein
VFTSDLLRLANLLSRFWRVGLDMLAPLFTGIGIYDQRLANRVGLHLALGGGFEPPPTP